MCGITGIFNTNQAPVDKELLQAMTNTLLHRGPDDEGLYVNGCIGLGHRRLSILDLSPAGHCPMPDIQQRAWITYNGEVYNYLELIPDLKERGYSFRSSSDTEVVLNSYLAHGSDCLRWFNGMWAFAIWDGCNRRLFCARDRFGVKPFYYTWRGQSFRFASEIKALLVDKKFPRRANNARVMDYLFNGLVDHTHETLFEGIYQLPPAHFLLVDDRGVQTECYWALNPSTDIPKNQPDQIEKFREIFTDAVRLRLRSDVPVGTCLSGGLDSSSIVCVADQLLRQGEGTSLGTRQKTFSACYNDPAIDERPYMRAVLAQTLAQGHEVYPTSTDVAQHLQKILWHQDEPFASVSPCAQYFVMQRAHQEQVTVILDGQGSDEMLAGYEPHWFPYMRDLLAERHWATFAWELWYSRQLLKLLHLQRPLSEVVPDSAYDYIWRSTRSRFFPGLRYLDGGNVAPPRYQIAVPIFSGSAHHLNQTLYRDFHGVRLQVLLHWEDRNSMVHSIESRTPFLDYRLVEYVFGLPLEQKRWRGETKVVLRRALQHLLPAKVANRRDKIGFATPTSFLLDSPVKQMITETIHSTSFKQRPFFDSQEAQHAWKSFQQGQHSSGRAVWQWLILEQWLRTFQISN
jgi:asparagine synthase (glutamine-hydrolysing)